MQLIRTDPRVASLLAGLAAAGSAQDAPPLPPPTPPGDGPSEGSAPLLPVDHRHSDLTVKLAYYGQQDGGGIPQLDERASVYEGLILFETDITDQDRLGVRLLTDVVSAASIKREHNASFRSLQSGASGNYRLGGGVNWTHHDDRWTWGGGLSAAAEYAYTSFGAGANLAWRSADRNTTIGARVQSYLDTVKLIRFDGSNTGNDNRDTWTIDLDWDQVLSPTWTANWSISHTEQSGFLATSYASVWVNGIEQAEVLPDSRRRDAVTGRVKHAWNDAWSTELGLRWYTDDWGIQAATADLRQFWWATPSTLLELQYRLHQQDASKHYRESFTASQPFQTSDPDLGDITAHQVGMTANFYDRTWLGMRGDWDIGFTWATRSNGIDSYWLMTGWHRRF